MSATRASRNRCPSWYGHLDVLINNGNGCTLSIELPIQDWDRILAVNLRGPFIMSKFALPVMKQGGGQIINICCCQRLGEHTMPANGDYWALATPVWKLDRIISKLRPWLLVECKLLSTGFPDIDVGTRKTQKRS